MKLNQNGYMLVEIVISFMIAIGIALYLLSLTYKFKNLDEDIYQSTIYLKEKAMIVKNVMLDLDKGAVVDCNCDGSSSNISFQFQFYDTQKKEYVKENRKISVVTENNVATFRYGKVDDGGNFLSNDVSFYQKELEKSLQVGNFSCEIDHDNIIFILKMNSIYDDHNYDIKLISIYSPI